MAKAVLEALTDDNEDCRICDHIDDDGEDLPDDVLHNPTSSCGRLEAALTDPPAA